MGITEEDTKEALIKPGRRKRARRSSSREEAAKNDRSSEIPLLEDSEIRIDALPPTTSGLPVVACPQPSKSLPILLSQRERGFSSSMSYHWQRRMLLSSTNNSQSWRPYALRKLAFTALETPFSDAVLALERNGSYVLSLGGPNNEGYSNVEGERPSLALRFYGIPSRCIPQKRAAILRRSMNHMIVSPLLLTIPLEYDSDRSWNRPYDDDLASLPSSIPVYIWLSSDSRVGVAVMRLWKNQDWEGASKQATVVIFPLPQSANSENIRIFKCDKIYITPETRHLTLRHLFWHVDLLPCPEAVADDDDPWLTFKVAKCPGYLYWVDEEEGYRLVWISESPWSNRAERRAVPESTLSIRPQSNQILTVCLDGNWEECISERHTGADGSHSSSDSDVDSIGFDSQIGAARVCRDDKPQLQIVLEARLNVIELLRDILVRRPQLAPNYTKTTAFPDYSYELIAVKDGGQTAELVITFDENPERGKTGVFLSVDLFNQRYEEQKWIKCGASASTTNKLALNQRMRCRRVGPSDSDNLCALLYPDCDVVDNRAVISQSPVMAMNCRAPIALVYG